MARTWRAEAIKGRNGGPITSWRLVTGRTAERVRLNLGAVTRDEAERCAVAMNEEEEETEGTPALHGRMVRMAATASHEELVAALLDADRGIKPGAVSPMSMTVSEYFDTWFWPARSDPTHRFGVAASTAKAEAGYWRNKSAGRGILDSGIGSTRLRDLADQHWVRFEDQHEQLSGRSMALRRAAYSALLAFARRAGHLDFKPEFFRIKGATKRTREQADPLSLDEVMVLMAAALKDPDPELGAMHRALWAPGSACVRVRWCASSGTMWTGMTGRCGSGARRLRSRRTPSP